MPPASKPIPASDLTAAVRQQSQVWLTTMVLGVFAALAYLALRTNAWEASLALVARDEATAGSGKPGKFARFEDMKTQQETVLELAKNRSVLHDVLSIVGPPHGAAAPDFPSDRTVDDLVDAIKVTPPKGAEFGKTEIFYLKVQDASRERAIALASQLLVQLQSRFADVRAKKAASVMEELAQAVSLAEAQLGETTTQLREIELEVGRDLADLRSLNESPSGETELRKTATEVQTELRTYRAAWSANQELLHTLHAALDDPGRLLASPLRLFDAQPALRRLKEGLVDAQLKSAQLAGTLTADHPQVIAAREAEGAVGSQLHTELNVAIRGVEVDSRLALDRVEALERQQAEIETRFDRLAALRADYGNLVSKAKMQTDTLRTALSELAEARASEAAAQTANLLTPVDRPDTGSRPIGAGKTLVLLSGLLGGLLVGIGWVVLTAGSEDADDAFETLDGECADFEIVRPATARSTAPVAATTAASQPAAHDDAAARLAASAEPEMSPAWVSSGSSATAVPAAEPAPRTTASETLAANISSETCLLPTPVARQAVLAATPLGAGYPPLGAGYPINTVLPTAHPQDRSARSSRAQDLPQSAPVSPPVAASLSPTVAAPQRHTMRHALHALAAQSSPVPTAH